MDETAPSSSSPAAMPIKEPNSNDVLLGRGPNFTNYEGNLRFHKLVNERKLNYTASSNREDKNRIAREVLALVHAAGGRFLKQEDPKDPYNENWVEANRAVSEEKIKQALREKQYYTTAPGAGVTRKREDGGASTEHFSSASLPVDNALTRSMPSSSSRVGGLSKQTPPPEFPLHSSPLSLLPGLGITSASTAGGGADHLTMGRIPHIVPSVTQEESVAPLNPCASLSDAANSLPLQSAVQSILDPRLLLFENTPLLLNQQGLDPRALLLINSALRSQLTNSVLSNPGIDPDVRLQLLHHLYSQPSVDAAVFQPQFSPMNLAMNDARTMTESACLQEEEGESRSLRDLHLSDDDGGPEVDDEQAIDWDLNDIKTLFSGTGGDESAEDESSQTTDDELASFLLSSLAVTGREVITEEELAKEREALTDEEKAALLVDTFGEMCSKDEAPQKKRAKRDLDPKSISFLVRQMKCELERIPAHEKNALLEAQAKCSSDEFSDARLEKFLRCEGMNAQMAAKRFVNYWKSRREVFGSEKFMLPMTLSGALRDDLNALQAGMYRLFPKLDASGRPILLVTPKYNTREGYDSDSLVRAVWYVIEVVTRENTHRECGTVSVVWGEGITIWDYDKAYDRLSELLLTSLPMKMLASHLCCMPRIITRVVSPIVHALLSKELRARLLVHTASSSEILQVLSTYGIERNMLPSEMGGSIEFNQVEWIENRRALEMEEIE